eukprot:12409921-Karenia_brevis.AAC.1
MAQVFQKSGALAFACSIQFHTGWVPSECSSAGPASRGRRSCRAELDTPQHVGKVGHGFQDQPREASFERE